jgi:hypothetical protein
MAEVREVVLRSLILETVEMSSSVIPSAKYSSPLSGLMLEKGRTAILRLVSSVLFAGPTMSSPRSKAR